MLAKLLVLFLSFPATAFALTIEQAYEELRTKPINYTNEGMICEQLMVLELKEYLAPTIKRGIIYRESLTKLSRILGELDVVVFDENFERAVFVIEVKCSAKPWLVLAHAREQLSRFRGYLGTAITLYLASNPREVFPQELFSDVVYLTASVKGSKEYGYDLALSLSKEEASELRGRLMACQDRGECPAPIAPQQVNWN